MQNCPMVLSEDDVRKVLRMEDLIPTMADALRDLSAGAVLQPLRSVLPVSEYGGFFGVMAACGRALGAKLVTFYPQNKNVPTHHAMILLFRLETGEPLAVMDGRLITEMRTAAVSAVATKLLARAATHVLTILGSPRPRHQSYRVNGSRRARTLTLSARHGQIGASWTMKYCSERRSMSNRGRPR